MLRHSKYREPIYREVIHHGWLITLFLIMSMTSLESLASVRLPRLVGDNMVLQRDASLNIWGWASAGEQITVSFRGHQVSTKANDKGDWLINLPSQQAGGPFEMTITGSNVITLKNILVGDVWLASGQSNMEFPMSSDTGFGGVVNEKEEIAAANYPQIRLFTVKRNTSLVPLSDVDSSGWSETTPQSIRQFSAVAYFFARDIQQHHHIPIGLIHSSWGGTPAEAWTSDATMLKFDDFREIMKRKLAVTQQQWHDYDVYLETRKAWYAKHQHDDRGTVDGKPVWSAADFNDASWPVTTMPKPWPAKLPKDFDGTIWLRKHVQLNSEQAKAGINLHLSKWVRRDTTYFNGHQVGTMDGGGLSRDYTVGSEFLKVGDNVIAMHVEGESSSGAGFVGSYVDPADVFIIAGNINIPLGGDWKYQPAPDLSELPEIPSTAEFRSPFPQAPTLLFNAMLAPLAQFKIKGAIWYQGEANAGRAAQYSRLFPAMIKDWRAAYGYEFPFLFVQLAGFGSDTPQPSESAWAELREAQEMTLSLPQTGMATAVDIGDAEDIHPRNKQEVGKRLALIARNKVYKEKVNYSGPRYDSMQVQGARIRLRFTDTDSGLMTKGNALKGFAIAGADGKYVWANAVIDGKDVIVSSDAIKQPVSVRYDWGNTPQGNLYNKEGLPALPFRTDKKN